MDDAAWRKLTDRDALLFLADDAAAQIRVGQDSETSEAARKECMRRAAADLGQIARQVDGCFDGDAVEDVIVDCYEVKGVHAVVQALLERISYVVEPPQER